ncbi:MAG: Ig-like domain-containing protein, partial [Candidatus Magasanikbacteria bacterium]|nr:Ig-like domain-containing protein [Candidatus Magasanikbacteria bacterium]
TGSLVVRLRAPKVIEWWPSCSSACRNAELGLRFSGPMRLSSVNEKTVRLEACGDAQCTRVTPVSLAGFSSAEGDTVVRFRSTKGLLAPGMTYRVVIIASEVKGRDGVALAGVESRTGQTMTTTNTRYSWTFRTLDTRAVCSVDHVAVAPEHATLTAIFAQQDFSAVPRSKSDACDVHGQRLIADGYVWAWATSEERVAALIDDKSPSDAWQQVEARGPGQSTVSAETGGKRGIGTVAVVCDAVDDRSCGAEHGVGIDRCCYPRPRILARQPEGDNACRNGVIEIQFDQPMDKGTVEKGTVIEQEVTGTSCAAPSQPQKLSATLGPNATPAKKVFCPVATRLTTSSDERLFTFAPATVLPQHAAIRVRVFGMDADGANVTVKNRAGVAMTQGTTWNFTTGALICQITTVRVYRDPTPTPVLSDTFLCSRGDNCADDVNSALPGNQHRFRVAAFDQEEHPVNATYVWSIEDPRTATLTPQNQEAEVTSGENGRTALAVHATATNAGGGKGSVVIPIDVTACANPWPARTVQGTTTLWEPFADRTGGTATNFSTYYCRDRGGPELDDDLPALAWPPGIETGFENDPKRQDLIKGFLFQVVGGGEPDAIGFEIFRNQEKKDIAAWYRAIFKNDNQNTPEPLTVNGYPGIRDGRTVYVNALNIQGSDVMMQVHLLSYGLGASDDTITIARQLEQNWRFTTSVTDDRDRAALQRDVTRMLALNGMRGALNSRGAPKLEAGSFIPGLTFSTWPLSWGLLGSSAGASFPRDPVNRFEGCTKPFDAATCWNPVRKKTEPLVKQFKCPTGALAYGYKVDPGSPQGYILATNFEYDGPGSFTRDPSYRSLDSLLGSGVCTK